MKAKEYAAQFVHEGKTVEALAHISRKFMEEIAALAEQRKVQTSDGWLAILRQQEEKWGAFVGIVDPGNAEMESAFWIALGAAFPDLIRMRTRLGMGW